MQIEERGNRPRFRQILQDFRIKTREVQEFFSTGFKFKKEDIDTVPTRF